MIHISLGSNLGNRLDNLRQAINSIKENILSNTYESIVLETKAITIAGSPLDWNMPYLNMVIAGESDLSAQSIMNELLRIEVEMGRPEKRAKWSPRIIDLDILLYNQAVINEGKLQIPHKELLNRDFFLHLLSLMPEKYQSNLYVDNKWINCQEYAHNNLDYNKLFDETYVLSNTKIMAVLNVTLDSFSDGGNNYNPEIAINNAKQMVANGAEVIDIGAQSTRPGGIEIIGPDAEYERVKPVLDGLNGISAEISIDTYHSKLVNRLLKEYKIDWINDVTGSLDKETLKNIASSGVGIISMHSLSVPPSRDNIIRPDTSAIKQMQNWCENEYNKLLDVGFSEDKIVLDPGIGFGKSIYQNINILRCIRDLRGRGYRILVGHSRKSFMSGFSSAKAADRDTETFAISSSLIDTNVDYLRVHNVKDFNKFMVAKKMVENA